jgi:hypothetical protein
VETPRFVVPSSETHTYNICTYKQTNKRRKRKKERKKEGELEREREEISVES